MAKKSAGRTRGAKKAASTTVKRKKVSKASMKKQVARGSSAKKTKASSSRGVRSTKSERIEVRVTPHQHSLLVQAAELRGQTMSEFIFMHASVAAREIVERDRVIQLSARDSKRFSEALRNPPSTPARLQEAHETAAQLLNR